jgi:hypothetical protein
MGILSDEDAANWRRWVWHWYDLSVTAHHQFVSSGDEYYRKSAAIYREEASSLASDLVACLKADRR